MLPDRLHPAIVHFPIVLAMFALLVAVVSLWAIRRGTAPVRAWSVTSGVLAALALSAWVATETSEGDEERVERVVGESALNGHEEAVEVFLYAAAGVLAPGSSAPRAGVLALPGARWRRSARALEAIRS